MWANVYVLLYMHIYVEKDWGQYVCGHAKEELLPHLDYCYMLLHLNMDGWDNN